MYAFAPNGSPICGTLESVPGCAETVDDSFERNDDGSLDYNHAGETDVWWDDQTTLSTVTGETIFVDRNGNQWAASQLVLSDDEDWEPEPESIPDLSNAEAVPAADALLAAARAMIWQIDHSDGLGWDDLKPEPGEEVHPAVAILRDLRAAVQALEAR